MQWFNDPALATDEAYRWFFHSNSHWPWKSLVFKPGIIPKHRYAFWLFAHKKFLTKDRQHYITDKQCVLCDQHPETFTHLFFHCEEVKALWNEMKNWLGLHISTGSSNALLRSFRGHLRGSKKIHKRALATIAATIYIIWEMRNKKIFEAESPDFVAAARKIKITILRIHGFNS